MRTHQVKEMISRLHSLIMGSPVVEWHRRLFDGDYAFISDKAASNLYKIKGPAAKAYIWLLIRQEELAAATRGPKLSVNDAELGQAIGATKTTAQNYRNILTKLKLIEIVKTKAGKINHITITKVKY
jgi:hypothetical protein